MLFGSVTVIGSGAACKAVVFDAVGSSPTTPIENSIHIPSS